MMLAKFNHAIIQVATATVLFSCMQLACAQARTDAADTPTRPDAAQPATEPDGKTLAEKFIGPTAGQVALIFNEQGDAIAVTREGRVLPSCQICTPELERVYGPKCIRARKASDAVMAAGKKTNDSTERKSRDGARQDNAAQVPLICDKLMDTNVLAVSPISMVKHTGSHCISLFFNSGGKLKITQYCPPH